MALRSLTGNGNEGHSQTPPSQPGPDIVLEPPARGAPGSNAIRRRSRSISPTVSARASNDGANFRRQAAAEVFRKRQAHQLAAQRRVPGDRIDGALERAASRTSLREPSHRSSVVRSAPASIRSETSRRIATPRSAGTGWTGSGPSSVLMTGGHWSLKTSAHRPPAQRPDRAARVSSCSRPGSHAAAGWRGAGIGFVDADQLDRAVADLDRRRVLDRRARPRVGDQPLEVPGAVAPPAEPQGRLADDHLAGLELAVKHLPGIKPDAQPGNRRASRTTGRRFAAADDLPHIDLAPPQDLTLTRPISTIDRGKNRAAWALISRAAVSLSVTSV